MRVKTLFFNWCQVGSVNDNSGAGEDYNKFEVGVRGVTKIIENEPTNGLQQWNYLISNEDGTATRVFNPNYVEYIK